MSILTVVTKDKGIEQQEFILNPEKHSDWHHAVVFLVKTNPILFHFLMSLYLFYAREEQGWNEKTADLMKGVVERLEL